MISDLAPIDLLIQRAGRLHRHVRSGRPASLADPRLWITLPDIEAGLPDFGADGYVYEPYVLLRSFATLQGRDRWVLPGDTPACIEAVYGAEVDEPQDPGLAQAIAAAREAMRRHQLDEVDAARQRLVAEPGAEDLMHRAHIGLVEDAPEVHRALQALTRLGPPSLSVVCLHRHGEALRTQPAGHGLAVDLARYPSPQLTSDLVAATVSVSHQGVFWHLLDRTSVPSGWRKHTLLKNCRAVVFEDGICALEGSSYTLHLTPALGLVIEKEAL
jgi:CRISPR-associated endonuclease/helicase Cas3